MFSRDPRPGAPSLLAPALPSCGLLAYFAPVHSHRTKCPEETPHSEETAALSSPSLRRGMAWGGSHHAELLANSLSLLSRLSTAPQPPLVRALNGWTGSRGYLTRSPGKLIGPGRLGGRLRSHIPLVTGYGSVWTFLVGRGFGGKAREWLEVLRLHGDPRARSPRPKFCAGQVGAPASPVCTCVTEAALAVHPESCSPGPASPRLASPVRKAARPRPGDLLGGGSSGDVSFRAPWGGGAAPA